MHERHLLIDDCRNLGIEYVARTYDAGIEMLKMGEWDMLWLDHDLGAIRKCYSDRDYELTGYDILCWLEEHPEYLPKKITVVSGNPSGAERMEKLVKKLYAKENQ